MELFPTFLLLLLFYSIVASLKTDAQYDEDIRKRMDLQPLYEHNLIGNSKKWTFRSKEKSDYLRILYEESGWVLVGGRETLYNISVRDFSYTKVLKGWQEEKENKNVCNALDKKKYCSNYVSLAVRLSDDRLLVCGTNAGLTSPTCRILRHSNSKKVLREENGMKWYAVAPFYPDDSFSYVYTGNQIFTAAMVYVDWTNAVIAKAIVPKSDDKEIQGLYTETTFADAATVHSFIDYENAYFLYRKGKNSQTSRIARICINDRGSYKNKDGGLPLWTSFVSIPIRCCIQRATYTFCFDKILGASGLQIGRLHPSLDSSKKLLYGLFESESSVYGGTAVCVFDKLSIDKGYDTVDAPKVMCPNNSQELTDRELTKRVNYREKIKKKVDHLTQSVPLLLQRDGSRFTAIDVDWGAKSVWEGQVDVLYLGTADGFLVKAINSHSTDIRPIIVERIAVLNERIISVKVLKNEKVILVLGKSVVKKISFSRCSQYLSCGRCVKARDPYCSWTGDECANSMTGKQNLRLGKVEDCNDDSIKTDSTNGNEKELKFRETSTRIESEYSGNEMAIAIVLSIILSSIVSCIAGYIIANCRLKHRTKSTLRNSPSEKEVIVNQYEDIPRTQSTTLSNGDKSNLAKHNANNSNLTTPSGTLSRPTLPFRGTSPPAVNPTNYMIHRPPKDTNSVKQVYL
ncbi:DgyrCDS11526 [Dimorphilus gyrociliatus]|uniref:DgyrCDS11526 n=1 Tax=Dimorphilus gyrociliatus TaxID=2664684 RepID=A0A7I8W655_9ANNE|nr:DgyrCDS11526 [Dimorphilus gyrociliatus]